MIHRAKPIEDIDLSTQKNPNYSDKEAHKNKRMEQIVSLQIEINTNIR